MVTGKSLAGKTGFIGNNTYGKSEKTFFKKPNFSVNQKFSLNDKK